MPNKVSARAGTNARQVACGRADAAGNQTYGIQEGQKGSQISHGQQGASQHRKGSWYRNQTGLRGIRRSRRRKVLVRGSKAVPAASRYCVAVYQPRKDMLRVAAVAKEVSGRIVGYRICTEK